MQIHDRFYDKFENADIEMRRDPEMEDLMMTRAALAMCENIDWNVGRVLSKLDQLELSEDTIVLFFTDNGPNSYRWNGGMKGRKGAIDEGGLRSPFLMRWPEKISAGSSIDAISGAIDLLPTIAELAGIDYDTGHPIDGRSLLPLIENAEANWEERNLLSIKNNQVSIRTQRFRLDHNGALFDIENDRGQRSDVSGNHPELVSQLRSLAEAHKAEMTRAFEKTAVGLSLLATRPQLPFQPEMEMSMEKSNGAYDRQTTLSSRIGHELKMRSPGQLRSLNLETMKSLSSTPAKRATKGPDSTDVRASIYESSNRHQSFRSAILR